MFGYALEACPVNKTQLKSFEFTINRTLMKIFQTTSLDIIKECKIWFNVADVSISIGERKKRFLAKYSGTENELCKVFAQYDV